MIINFARMKACCLVVLLTLYGGACLAKQQGERLSPHPPQRIVSLNLCTDQLLMMLVPPSRIAAVSYFSRQPLVSVMAQTAANLPINYGKAEEVFLLKPDLILSGTYSARTTVSLLRKLGRNVVTLRPANSFDELFRNIEIIGKAVGEPAKAAKMIAASKAELLKLTISPDISLPLAVLYFANGYSSGQNTLVDEVVGKAGFNTLGQKRAFSGTRKLSLEALILVKSDVLILGQRSYKGDAMAYENFKHPVLRYLKKSMIITSLTDALTICGTPQTIRAVKKLREFRREYFGAGTR